MQPHTRFSLLSNSSLPSADHLPSSNASTSINRFSLPTTPSINTTLGSQAKAPPRNTIYDRPLNKTRTSEVSTSAFAFLFSEIIQYTQKRVSGIEDLERRFVLFYSFSPPSSTLYYIIQLKYSRLSDWNTLP